MHLEDEGRRLTAATWGTVPRPTRLDRGDEPGISGNFSSLYGTRARMGSPEGAPRDAPPPFCCRLCGAEAHYKPRAECIHQLRGIPHLRHRQGEGQAEPVGTAAAAASAELSCVLQMGRLYAFGVGVDGALGLGQRNNLQEPTLVPFPKGVAGAIQVSCGLAHTLALDASGRPWIWGNHRSNLGEGSAPSSRLARQRSDRHPPPAQSAVPSKALGPSTSRTRIQTSWFPLLS